MAESTLNPPSGFEQGTPGLGIQHLNHYAIVPRPLANFNGSKQIQIDLKSFATTDNLVKTTVCDTFDKNCVWRNCDNCPTNSIYKLFEPLQTFYNDQITVYQLERVLLEKESNSLKMTRKAPQVKYTNEVINMLEKPASTIQYSSTHKHCSAPSV